MEAGTIVNRYYSAENGTKNVSGTRKFTLEKTADTKGMSEAEEMEIFKKEFYDDLSKITSHKTVSNVAVNISEEAFKNMKADPKYREKVLSLIKRDWGDSYAPRNCSVLITVGATLDDYRGASWPVGHDSEFHMRSQNSFYKKTSEKKNQLKKYIEKRIQERKLQQELWNDKITKQKLKHNQLLQSWNNEKRMAEVSDAYEATAIVEITERTSFEFEG